MSSLRETSAPQALLLVRHHVLAYFMFHVCVRVSHSSLLAVMLDGRGLYGKWEGSGSLPTDLDACGGHYGPVPAVTLPLTANQFGDTSYPASAG